MTATGHRLPATGSEEDGSTEPGAGSREPEGIACRKCGKLGEWRQLILVVVNRKQQCQKVVTGNFHCPEHEFPETAAPAVARSQWPRIVANFKTVANGEEPIIDYTKLFYWPAGQELPPIDVHVMLPA